MRHMLEDVGQRKGALRERSPRGDGSARPEAGRDAGPVEVLANDEGNPV